MKRRLLCLAAFAFILPMTMLAQTTGILSGKITGDDGKPVIGATVRVLGTTQGAKTKADGTFIIAGIRAADYEVQISSVGFVTEKQSVHVSVDQTTTLNVKLSTTEKKTGQVTVRAQMVRPEKTGTISTTTAADLDHSVRTNIAAVVALAGGVTTGGVNGFSIRGGRSEETNVQVDGVKISDPFSGGFGNTNASLYPTVSTLAVSEVQVIASGFSAEYGDVLSGVVNSVTKSGRNDKYEGSFRFRTQVGALWGNSSPITVKVVGTDRDTTLPALQGRSSGSKLYEFGFGGPIPFTDKVTFYLTGKYNPIDHFGTSGYSVFDISPESAQQRAGIAASIGQPVLTPTDISLLPNSTAMIEDVNAKLKFTISDQINVELSGEYGLSRREFPSWGTYYFLDPATFKTPGPGRTQKIGANNDTTYVDNSILERDHQGISQNTIIQRGILHYTQYLDAATYFEVTGSFVHNRNEEGRKEVRSYGAFEPFNIYYPEDTDSDGIIDKYFSPTIGTKPIPNAITGFIEGDQVPGASYNPFGLNDGNFPAHGASRTLEFRDAVTATVKGDYETNFDLSDVKTRVKAGFELSTYTLKHHLNSLPWDRDPFFDIYGYSSTYFKSDSTGTLNAFFTKPYHPLQGALYLQTNFAYKSINFQPGVRFDFLNPNAPIAPVRRDNLLDVVRALDTTGNSSLKFQVSPRIGVSYPITEKSQFRVNFAVLFKMPDFDLLYDDAFGSTARGNQIFGNPNIDPQKTFDYELGYESEFADGYYIDVSAYYRDIFNQTGVTYVPVLPSPYTLYSVQEYGNVRGLEIQARRQLMDNFAVTLNYSLMQARGTASSPDANYSVVIAAVDPFTNEPQKFPLTEFPLDYDQTHTVNATLDFVWGTGQGPAIGSIRPLENASITLTGTFATGLPYTLEDPKGSQVGEYNSQRLPSQFSIETHIEKGFKLKDLFGDAVGDLELGLYADISNLLNSTGPVSVKFSRTSGTSRFSITGSPDYDGGALQRGIGNFSATNFYRDIDPARGETMAADQYDIYGRRMYNVYADTNLDGVETQAEKYDGYRRFVAAIQAERGTYQFPRQVSVGFKIKF